MFTIMKDPVILPSSRTIIDRATIKAHLLSDTTDPFNRVPLKIGEVIPGEPTYSEDSRIGLMVVCRHTIEGANRHIPRGTTATKPATIEGYSHGCRYGGYIESSMHS